MKTNVKDRNLIFAFMNDEFENILTKKNFNQNDLVIALDNQTKAEFLKNRINCKMINDYSLSDIQASKPLEWLKNWQCKILQNEKNFNQLFTYDNVSIFWYLESRLYHKRIHKLITLIEQIKEIISVEKPKSIEIIGDSELFYIVSQLHNDTKFYKKIDKISKSSISENNYAGFLIWKLFLLKLIRGTLTSKSKSNKDKKIILLTEIGSWRKTFNFVSNTYEYQDVFFHHIINKLKEKNQSIEIIDFEK